MIPTLAFAVLLAVPPAPPASSVARVLDDWHGAAAAADETRYFSHFSPDAVFLGTDGTERWTVSEFRRFAHPYFAKGKAWSFRAHSRHVAFSPEGTVAWFDEALDTPNLGPARGSGVLVRPGGEWKIAQYNLSIPIPNDLTSDFKARIEEFLRRPQTPVPSRSPAPSRN
ncbi:MAG: nuclear transport factor 2 family protein [Acidobacteria bacterium]|nr:nuclear transport factor 2 family protein [Acidobacteriota bacterium]MCA1611638.1 nuclear transport factor 2 family protein [Acidobacteriota bacterium]